MPRLRTDHDDYARRRKDAVCSTVTSVLRAEGILVKKPHRLEEGRARNEAGQARTSDWVMTLDGEPTALEVTRLLPPAQVRKAEIIVTHLEAGMRGFLAPVITEVGGQVLLALAYSARGVVERRRDRLASDTRILASEVRQTLHRLVEGAEPLQLKSPISWVVRAELTLVPGPHDGFFIVQAPDGTQPDLDDFVARTINSRRERHLDPAERAILAVEAEFADADDLREAFGRSPVPVPWWRVYLVHRSDATLVHQGTP
jgi:hypothetical protein